MDLEVAFAAQDKLGESPVWCERTGMLYWVDSRAPGVHRLDPATGQQRFHSLPEVTGSICLCEDGSLLVALVTCVQRFSFDTGLGDVVATPVPNHPDNRFNDGRCDRAGRFWVGTLNDRERIPTGVLWRLQSDLDFQSMEEDIIVPNSLAFAPDNRRMYMADTYRHRIDVFDYDMTHGTIANRREFADSSSAPGRPDGSAIDADGCLWNARYAGGCVIRYTPEGKVDRVIQLPVSQPTCCAFGGANLDELYITTARQRLSAEALAAEPLAGNVFVIRPGVQGLPEGRFGAPAA